MATDSRNNRESRNWATILERYGESDSFQAALGETVPEVNIPNPDAHLSPQELCCFGEAIRALHQSEVPFLVAGGLALYHYTGFWRETKDLDLLILPQDRDRAIAAFEAAGLMDLYEDEPYDREWIFRTKREGIIVDLIWRMANKADDVAPSWFSRSTGAILAGEPVQVVSAADLCWLKLFVFQAKRCDWPHILNIVRGTQGNLDWELLLSEVGSHWRLLCAVTDLFDWLCPEDRHFIPEDFRLHLQQLRAANTDLVDGARNDLLDIRPWLTQPGAGFTGSVPQKRRITRVPRRPAVRPRCVESEGLAAVKLTTSSLAA